MINLGVLGSFEAGTHYVYTVNSQRALREAAHIFVTGRSCLFDFFEKEKEEKKQEKEKERRESERSKTLLRLV